MLEMNLDLRNVWTLNSNMFSSFEGKRYSVVDFNDIAKICGGGPASTD